VVDTAPVTPDSSATVPVADDSSVQTTTTRTVKRTTRTAAAKPAAAPARTVTTRTVTTHASAPVAAAAPVPAPAASKPVAQQSAVAPIVDTSAKPSTPPAKSAARPAGPIDNTELMFGGGALALLALGGAAFAMSRRRRHEDEWVDEPAMEYEPAVEHDPVDATPVEARHDPVIHQEEPAMSGPSAFAWSGEQSTAAQQPDRDADDDRLPGESWVERAYRGPSSGNPSVSLKHRLRRAAFFDKRERDVAAGLAEPVDMDAGLPDAMVEEQERELA
jgi:hypothetical protein